jgi:hypothetical protein
MRPSRFRVRQKGGTFTGAGQSYRRDLCRHIGYRPSSNRQPRMLVSQTDPLLPSAAEPSIFMLGGAPEAHEVLSKTPRIEFHFVVKVSCPRRFRSSLATIRKETTEKQYGESLRLVFFATVVSWVWTTTQICRSSAKIDVSVVRFSALSSSRRQVGFLKTCLRWPNSFAHLTIHGRMSANRCALFFRVLHPRNHRGRILPMPLSH